ncbi:MAG: hypothetical protein MI923_10310 [Phycisphaerales bacterium]|nr:hypothetical protein [Phycisphaerales bacterium]
MTKPRNTLKIGSFTILVVILFFMVLVWISKGVGGDMQTVVIHFEPSPSMPTIVPGSAVLVGGQKVGQVVEAGLALVGDDGDPNDIHVLVKAEVLASLKLRTDCAAVAEGPPLGGDGLVKLNLGKAADPFDGDYIKGAEPGGLGAIVSALQGELNGDDPDSLLGKIKLQLDPKDQETILGKIHESLSHVNAMTESMAKELGPGEGATLLAKLHEIVDNINRTTGQLRRELDAGEPQVLLQKAHLAMDAINDGIDSVSRILKTGEVPITNALVNIEKTTANIAIETDSSRADSLLAHLKTTNEQIGTAVKDVNTITSTMRDVVVLNRDNINRLLVNFKEASDHVKTGVKYVLRHPWRLLNAPTAQEMKQQAVFDAARSFSEAATRIDDASSQLRALAELHDGVIPNNDPDLEKIRADLLRTHQQYKKAEAELWKLLGGVNDSP